MEGRELTVRVEEEMPTRYKVAIGGGALLAIWFLFFRGGKGAGSGPGARRTDSEPLRFRMLTTGRLLLVADGSAFTVEDAIKRIKEGGRSDVILVVPGDVLQGSVVATLNAFMSSGIEVIRG
jgi:hypothetical protein